MVFVGMLSLRCHISEKKFVNQIWFTSGLLHMLQMSPFDLVQGSQTSGPRYSPISVKIWVFCFFCSNCGLHGNYYLNLWPANQIVTLKWYWVRDFCLSFILEWQLRLWTNYLHYKKVSKAFNSLNKPKIKLPN